MYKGKKAYLLHGIRLQESDAEENIHFFTITFVGVVKNDKCFHWRGCKNVYKKEKKATECYVAGCESKKNPQKK